MGSRGHVNACGRALGCAVHFWGPAANWGLVIAVSSLCDLAAFHIRLRRVEFAFLSLIRNIGKSAHCTLLQGLMDINKPVEMVSLNMTGGE